MSFDSEHVTGSDRCVATRAARRKCHNDEAGYVAQRDHPFLRGRHVVLYLAELQAMDTDGGRYTIVCEGHGSSNVNTTSRRVAYDALRDPEMFCDGCREHAV